MIKLNEKLKAVISKYKRHPEFLGITILGPNHPGAVDDTLLHVASRTGDTESIEVLINSGAKVDSIGDLGNTPLHQAAMRGQLDSVKMLLQNGANSKIENEFKQTALEVAEIAGHKDIVKILRKT